MSNFSCSLTRNITPHSMKNLAVHSLLSWQIIILPILTTSLIRFSFEGLGECSFRTWEWKGSAGTGAIQKWWLFLRGGGHSVSYWVGVCCWPCQTLTLFKRVIRKIWHPVQEYSFWFGTLFKTGPQKSVECFEHYAMLRHMLNVLTHTGSCNATHEDSAGSLGNKYPVQDTNMRIVYPVWDRDPWKPYPIQRHIPV